MSVSTRTSRYRQVPGDIIVQEIYTGGLHSIQDAKDNVAAFNRVAGGRKHGCLVDMQVEYQTARGVREYYASPEAAECCYAIAMVVRSPITRIIGNLFLALNRSPVPVRMFASVDDGLAWLRRYSRA